jgi:hypothetical protein
VRWPAGFTAPLRACDSGDLPRAKVAGGADGKIVRRWHIVPGIGFEGEFHGTDFARDDLLRDEYGN